MTRLSAQPIRHRLLIAATTAASAVLLRFLGFEYGSQFLSPETAVRQPAPATGSTDSVSANRLELSVFDQPRALSEIRFQDDQGHDLTLADFRGRVVLLNIWATWCVPCRKEMPALDRLQARLGSKDFLAIPLSIDREGVAPVLLSRRRGRKARDLCRSVWPRIAQPRHSGCADDIADRPRGPGGRPKDGCRRMG